MADTPRTHSRSQRPATSKPVSVAESSSRFTEHGVAEA